MALAYLNGPRRTTVPSSSSCGSTSMRTRSPIRRASDICSSTRCTSRPRSGREILDDAMIVTPLVLLVLLAAGSIAASPTGFQSPRDGGCTEWRECRQLALAAADRGEYETFHDLAWRAVQTGPPKDPALMYLLARAQALSGRPHDALVMLERLAEMGVPSDAATNEDFKRTRQLPGWPEVSARIDRLTHPDPPPAAPAAAASNPPSSAPAL